ncbi:MAG TPA: MFS transporter, partial [Solirubrobacteraceae bacterium]|nr:MFS transporter [Solirubrobacteraceae bacterium]
VGSLSDRRGRLAPLRFGLAASTVALLCFTLPRSVPVLALVIVGIVAALGVFWAPSMALLSDAAEAADLHQGLAAALMNLAWAGGQILGSGGGGALAKLIGGDGLPVAIAAVACAATLAALAGAARWRRGRVPAGQQGEEITW